MKYFVHPWSTFLLAASLTAALTGCSGAQGDTSATAETASAAGNSLAETRSEAAAQPSAEDESAPKDAEDTAAAPLIRVGSLKGPTSMGLVQLMDSASSANSYEFTMVTAADELTADMVSGKLDIALMPANTASILYNKTNAEVTVIDINTLGVLYIASSDSSLSSVSDLKGKTIYLTGKGTTPDYVLRYLLAANGLSESDVTLEYKSEAAEVAAVLQETPDAAGLLPQPFATVAVSQNDRLSLVLDLTAEWDKIQEAEGSGSRLVTGVTVVRNEFLESHEEEVLVFLSDHKTSSELANTDVEKTAELVAAQGIIEKAPLAQKAIPYCSITYIDGQEMKAALSGYLEALFEMDPKSVGGALPDDGFYYLP